MAEARADILGELRDVAHQDLRRELTRLQREVREAAQKEAAKLRQECNMSMESQVRRGMAASESSERRVEEMLRDHRTRERSEARVVANTAEAFCEEEAKAAAAKLEEKAKLMAWQAEESTRRLAQTMQDQATFAVKLAEATAQRCAARAEERAEELTRRAQEDVADSCKSHMEDFVSSKMQAVESIQEDVRVSVQTTVSTMEEATQAVAARCRAGELLAEQAEGESSAAAQNARNAQELAADLQQSLGSSRTEWDEMRSELHAFVDEQRVFCGFLDTEQRSYHDLIRQEVTSLSRLVDASLRIDPGLDPAMGSPTSRPTSVQVVKPVEPSASMAQTARSP